MLFKKQELIFAELAGKIDTRKDYSFREIAELFQLDAGTIRKWHDVGFVAEESGESCRLQVKENQQVSGRELLHFVDRGHFNKVLFDKKFYTILGVVFAVAF
jgi:predicted ATPase